MIYTETVELKITIHKKAFQALKKAPPPVQRKAFEWVQLIQAKGLAATRQLPGFHDEPLSGKLQGQRSIRLNKQWRLFYTEQLEAEKTVLHITIIEVNAHEYR
jgi:proteic killer suppression protein